MRRVALPDDNGWIWIGVQYDATDDLWSGQFYPEEFWESLERQAQQAVYRHMEAKLR